MYKIINTGKFYADGGSMFGAIPKVSWSRCYPVNDRNLCVLAMNMGVIVTACGRIIVVDPGVGEDCLKDTPAVYYQFHEMRNVIEALINEAGINVSDVTDVVFTHLHFDHCGGAVHNGMPVFPNAVHWISRKQYDNEKQPHPLEKESFLFSNTIVLENAALLRIIEEDTIITENFKLHIYDGHTPGQITVFVRSENNTSLIFPGDVIPLASQVVPERISAYDLNPSLSWYSKIDILNKAVANKNIMVFYHDVLTPYAAVKQVGKSYKTVL